MVLRQSVLRSNFFSEYVPIFKGEVAFFEEFNNFGKIKIDKPMSSKYFKIFCEIFVYWYDCLLVGNYNYMNYEFERRLKFEAVHSAHLRSSIHYKWPSLN